MLLVYSFLLSLGFLLMSPLFLLRREKYASGFKERLGNYPEFKHDGRKVIWLHCVSVGETNAARPLVDQLLGAFPDHRLVMSTTTKTGQELAQKIFHEKADAVVYFPFDWKFSVRKALANYKPSLVLLMETEIWPRFIREAKLTGAKIAIVNGRLSKRSFDRYSQVPSFVGNVLGELDIALMQGEDDVHAIRGLGMDPKKIAETGNLKFDLEIDAAESEISHRLRERFELGRRGYLIVAASTHSPEEKLILDAFEMVRRSLQTKSRLIIAPRHPERFDEVTQTVRNSGISITRRSAPDSSSDKSAEVIILDSIGELRAVFPLADIVFVGGSLIPHGGQSVLEPAAAGRAIVTGPYTENFKSVVDVFLNCKALVQLPHATDQSHYVKFLEEEFKRLLLDPVEREFLGRTAKSVMDANRGATAKTVEFLRPLLDSKTGN
jgi:3-deoxy-D-manno-octulosonic-acid transferase